MYRGIRGTFIYACDKDLQEYFKNHIPIFKAENNLKILPFDQVNPFFNAIPILYIYMLLLEVLAIYKRQLNAKILNG